LNVGVGSVRIDLRYDDNKEAIDIFSRLFKNGLAAGEMK
jgi:hypothetical protein